MIWAGTDDGNVQVTRDGGKTWTNVVGNIHGIAEERLGVVGRSRALRAGTAYATSMLHNFGDMPPYVYKTTDYGQTLDAAGRRRLAGARLRPCGQGGSRQPESALPRVPSSACGFPSMAARTGHSTKAATCRTSPCATWRSIRAITIS